MDFFSIDNTFFTAAGYGMSYLEFLGVVSGIIAVWFSAEANIWSWIIGVINVSLSFFLFYQGQLYPDMFLQVFFFVTNLLGWWQWAKPKIGESNAKNELKISYTPQKQVQNWLIAVALGTGIMGMLAGHLHEWFPLIFQNPSAFPYLDSFTAVASIVATFLMIRKRIECWYLWIVIDTISCYIYFVKGFLLYSVLYFVFCFIAAKGAWYWKREWQTY